MYPLGQARLAVRAAASTSAANLCVAVASPPHAVRVLVLVCWQQLVVTQGLGSLQASLLQKIDGARILLLIGPKYELQHWPISALSAQKLQDGLGTDAVQIVARSFSRKLLVQLEY